MHHAYFSFIVAALLININYLCFIYTLNKSTVNTARSYYLLYTHNGTY